MQHQKSSILFNSIGTFVSPKHTCSSAGKIFVYMLIQSTKREKYFNRNFYTGKLPTLAGNKHFFVHFFFQRQRLFHLSAAKCTVLIRQKWTSKCLFLQRHNKRNHKQKIKEIFQKRKVIKIAPDKSRTL